jgi:hypothetical protein
METSNERAPNLHKCFYSLDGTECIGEVHPYAGKYQFVSLLKSCKWPVYKIWKLAKTHEAATRSLCPIFFKNLQDLNKMINEQETLREGFLGMKHIEFKEEGSVAHSQPRLKSIHYTGKRTTKVALVLPHLYDPAIHQLSAIHTMLKSYITPEYFPQVLIEDKIAAISG